jgi:hypothetical protein
LAANILLAAAEEAEEAEDSDEGTVDGDIEVASLSDTPTE